MRYSLEKWHISRGRMMDALRWCSCHIIHGETGLFAEWLARKIRMRDTAFNHYCFLPHVCFRSNVWNRWCRVWISLYTIKIFFSIKCDWIYLWIHLCSLLWDLWDKCLVFLTVTKIGWNFANNSPYIPICIIPFAFNITYSRFIGSALSVLLDTFTDDYHPQKMAPWDDFYNHYQLICYIDRYVIDIIIKVETGSTWNKKEYMTCTQSENAHRQRRAILAKLCTRNKRPLEYPLTVLEKMNILRVFNIWSMRTSGNPEPEYMHTV